MALVEKQGEFISAGRGSASKAAETSLENYCLTKEISGFQSEHTKCCVFLRITLVIEGERGNNEAGELTGTPRQPHQPGRARLSGRETFNHVAGLRDASALKETMEH